MAKRFFYVCAGLFLLALTYHLGARNAGAQAGPSFTVGGVSYWACVVSADRMVSTCFADGGSAYVFPNPVPGSQPVIAVEMTGAKAYVVLGDGVVYRASIGGPWIQTGNLDVFGPTAVTKESWGAVKDKYRK